MHARKGLLKCCVLRRDVFLLLHVLSLDFGCSTLCILKIESMFYSESAKNLEIGYKSIYVI